MSNLSVLCFHSVGVWKSDRHRPNSLRRIPTRPLLSDRDMAVRDLVVNGDLIVVTKRPHRFRSCALPDQRPTLCVLW